MAKIAFNDLPQWAQKEINRSRDSMSSNFIDGHSLSIMNGKAVYDGKTVGAIGEVVDANAPDETIKLSELPGWARTAISRQKRGSISNISRAGGSLQINQNGVAYFDGKLVVKGNSSGWRRFLPF